MVIHSKTIIISIQINLQTLWFMVIHSKTIISSIIIRSGLWLSSHTKPLWIPPHWFMVIQSYKTVISPPWVMLELIINLHFWFMVIQSYKTIIITNIHFQCHFNHKYAFNNFRYFCWTKSQLYRKSTGLSYVSDHQKPLAVELLNSNNTLCVLGALGYASGN